MLDDNLPKSELMWHDESELLSVRLSNCIARADAIVTVGDLRHSTDRELMRKLAPNFGKVSFAELRALLTYEPADRDDTANASSTVAAEGDGADQRNNAPKAGAEVSVPSPLDQLAELQVRRKFYIGSINKQTNAAKALMRRFLGWRYDANE